MDPRTQSHWRQQTSGQRSETGSTRWLKHGWRPTTAPKEISPNQHLGHKATTQEGTESPMEQWMGSVSALCQIELDWQKLPPDNFLHIIDQLQYNQVSLLTQLRTGHIPLNQILCKIKQVDHPYCPHCGLGTHETITHYIFFCSNYARARRLL